MIELRLLRGVAAAALLISFNRSTGAQDLSNQLFTLRYDGTGVHSLRRTADKYDTDYIATNAALGQLLIRYRSAPNGDWRELRDPIATRNAGSGAVEYVLGMLKPTLASKASAVADDLSRVEFVVENRTGGTHSTELMIAGLPGGSYAVTVDGKIAGTVKGSADQMNVTLPIGASSSVRVQIRKSSS
jgi:hypothetical protein